MFVEQNVRWFEIAMEYSMWVEVIESADEIVRQLLSSLFTQRSNFSQQFMKIRNGIFTNKNQFLFRFKWRQKTDNVRMCELLMNIRFLLQCWKFFRWSSSLSMKKIEFSIFVQSNIYYVYIFNFLNISFKNSCSNSL